ncbi:MAG: hypothetical protein Phog2KO_09950 [Phototrophicaceae bacterium]
MAETTFTEHLAKFQEASTEFIRLAESYPKALQTQLGACGEEWSAREVLAHINGWLVEAQRRYPRYATGTGKVDYNIDAFNQVSVWLRDGKGFEEILDELKRLSSKMAEMASAINPIYLEKDERYEKWLTIFLEEYEEHSQQLRDFLTDTR